MSKEENAAPMSVVEKLRAAKEARSGSRTFRLKTSGIAVSIPLFRAQGPWSKAAQMAGKNTAQISTYYIVMVAKFEGESLTIGEYQELIPADDHIQISGELFGGDETDAEGNGPVALNA